MNKKNDSSSKKIKPITRKKKIIRAIVWSVAIIILVFVGTKTGKFIGEVLNPFPSHSYSSPTPSASATTPSTSTPTPSVTPSGFETPTPSPTSTPAPTPTPEPTPDYGPFIGTNYINILLIGYDRNVDRVTSYSTFRTDTLILATIYWDQKKVVLTSIPRDTYVLIGNTFKSKDKINACPAYAKIQKKDTYEVISNTVSRLMGDVNIDFYFAIDMDVFMQVIDIMGGVDYDVDVDIYETGTKNLLLQKGPQHLNGSQSLLYVRHRYTQLGDIDRVSRQRKFLMSVFSQLKSMNQIGNFPKIYQTVMSNIETNLTFAQLTGLALFAADVDEANITGNTLPGFFLTKNNISYWGVNQKKRVALIKSLFDITIEPEEQDKNDI